MTNNELFAELAHHVRNDLIHCQKLQTIAGKNIQEAFKIINKLDRNLQILMDEARKPPPEDSSKKLKNGGVE